MSPKPWSQMHEHPALLPATPALRGAAAVALHRASRLLRTLALQLAAAPARRQPVASQTPLLEFHAEAGAPEGALYVDGLFVGHLPNVHRL